MKTDTTEKLFAEVEELHDSNVDHAKKTAANASKIGVLLFQIKEIVGHGGFLPSMQKRLPTMSQRCAYNYMDFARKRAIEQKAQCQIKVATVANLPAEGKAGALVDAKTGVPVVASDAIPVGAIPQAAWEAAEKEVDQMKWTEAPKEFLEGLSGNIDGKSLTQLFREYGVVRQKEPKVYHPPRKLSPDEKIEAENAQAEELLAAAERALEIIAMDLCSKHGTLASRIRPGRWKEFLRKAVGVTKAARPLSKRKLSQAELAADKKSKTSALKTAAKARLAARWEKAKAISRGAAS